MGVCWLTCSEDLPKRMFLQVGHVFVTSSNMCLSIPSSARLSLPLSSISNFGFRTLVFRIKLIFVLLRERESSGTMDRDVA